MIIYAIPSLILHTFNQYSLSNHSNKRKGGRGYLFISNRLENFGSKSNKWLMADFFPFLMYPEREREREGGGGGKVKEY